MYIRLFCHIYTSICQGYESNYVVVVAPSEEHATEGMGVVALSIPSETGGTEGYEGMRVCVCVCVCVCVRVRACE